MENVDFVVNCYERTYRQILSGGVLSKMVKMNNYPFAEITLSINNVEDRGLAAEKADNLLRSGEISRYFFVGEHFEQALRTTGLKRRSFRKLQNFSNCCLVAVCLKDPPRIVYWDAEIRLIHG